MSVATSPVTADELLQNYANQRCELVRGELRLMSPAGSEHGFIVNNVAFAVTSAVRAQNLGTVFCAETGFLIQCNPDTVRAPDVGFVRGDRIQGGLTRKFFPGPPDLAVEVLSPGDPASEVHEKAEDWLRAGCQEVWLVDPRLQRVSKLTLVDNEIRHENLDDQLASDVLPGFAMPVSEIFRL
ncbi:Uma2 family endonuclease [bacterium]|nr:Uma2 family endonuclease [bacterium]